MRLKFSSCFAVAGCAAAAAALLSCHAPISMDQHRPTADSGLSLADMDLAADPGADFYRYANGGWLAANPVPSDETRWGVFNEVEKRNEVVLKQLLEEAAVKPSDALHRMLGDFYSTGMDVAAIENDGVAPLASELAAIDRIDGVAALPALLAHLHSIGVSAIFGIGPLADFSDSTRNVLAVAQDGMGLPERDYYLRSDAESVELRRKYELHIAKMLALLGAEVDEARASAATIVSIETALAKSAFGAVDFRNPQNLSNKVAVAKLEELAPRFAWKEYFAALGIDAGQPVNLIAPAYFQGLDALLGDRPVGDWKRYLTWQLLHANAEYLSQGFDQESFRFYGTELSGAKEQRPRWKRVLDATGGAMGEALGQAFVAKSFSPRAKERCERMVGDLVAALRARIEKLPWMGEATRAKALGKLAAFKTKIGYPDRWRDWSGAVVGRDSYAQNHLRLSEFNFRYALSKVSRPVDPAEWGMPAFLVNAQYDPTKNDITFPAGILQPPFFSEDYDDALNYGAMGAVIGHEITHGFDDEGSQFDAKGNLENWWTQDDRAEFERRAQVVVEQFSSYVAIDDLHVNGKLTLGENLADLGGVTVGYDALLLRIGKREVAPIDGFTPEQRFFLAWARAWRCNYTPEAMKLQVNTNPHAPARFRAIGPLSNCDAFQAAFGLTDASPTLRPKAARARVW